MSIPPIENPMMNTGLVRLHYWIILSISACISYTELLALGPPLNPNPLKSNICTAILWATKYSATCKYLPLYSANPCTIQTLHINYSDGSKWV